jgi:hypothetical protein
VAGAQKPGFLRRYLILVEKFGKNPVSLSESVSPEKPSSQQLLKPDIAANPIKTRSPINQKPDRPSTKNPIAHQPKNPIAPSTKNPIARSIHQPKNPGG